MPDPSASTEEMDRLFQPRSRLLAMAAFEAALAAASAEAGVVPKAAAAVIAEVCASESFDADEIFQAQRLAGNPAIPFVRQLTERVARRDAEAAAWVHVGATTHRGVEGTDEHGNSSDATSLVADSADTSAETPPPPSPVITAGNNDPQCVD